MNPDVEALMADLYDQDWGIQTETGRYYVARDLVARGWTKLSDLGDDN